MNKHYKTVLANAGIDATNDDIENIANIINQACYFGCKIDIYDLIKILSPSTINATVATETLSKIIKGIKK